MADNTLTGKIVATEYASTSYYGNPAYYVTISTEADDTVTLRTMDNSMFAYACQNPEYRDEAHTFILTRAGRIRYAKAA